MGRHHFARFAMKPHSLDTTFGAFEKANKRALFCRRHKEKCLFFGASAEKFAWYRGEPDEYCISVMTVPKCRWCKWHIARPCNWRPESICLSTCKCRTTSTATRSHSFALWARYRAQQPRYGTGCLNQFCSLNSLCWSFYFGYVAEPWVSKYYKLLLFFIKVWLIIVVLKSIFDSSFQSCLNFQLLTSRGRRSSTF